MVGTFDKALPKPLSAAPNIPMPSPLFRAAVVKHFASQAAHDTRYSIKLRSTQLKGWFTLKLYDRITLPKFCSF
jgi:hypothetical protein